MLIVECFVTFEFQYSLKCFELVSVCAIPPEGSMQLGGAVCQTTISQR